jgi:hypothetical protein
MNALKRFASSEFLSALLIGGVMAYGFLAYLHASDQYKDFYILLDWIFK